MLEGPGPGSPDTPQLSPGSRLSLAPMQAQPSFGIGGAETSPETPSIHQPRVSLVDLVSPATESLSGVLATASPSQAGPVQLWSTPGRVASSLPWPTSRDASTPLSSGPRRQFDSFTFSDTSPLGRVSLSSSSTSVARALPQPVSREVLDEEEGDLSDSGLQSCLSDSNSEDDESKAHDRQARKRRLGVDDPLQPNQRRRTLIDLVSPDTSRRRSVEVLLSPSRVSRKSTIELISPNG